MAPMRTSFFDNRTHPPDHRHKNRHISWAGDVVTLNHMPSVVSMPAPQTDQHPLPLWLPQGPPSQLAQRHQVLIQPLANDIQAG